MLNYVYRIALKLGLSRQSLLLVKSLHLFITALNINFDNITFNAKIMRTCTDILELFIQILLNYAREKRDNNCELSPRLR